MGGNNRLKEMWSENFQVDELILGSGHYTNSDESYYMNVDPGILRVPLFMGVVGYMLVWIYQLVIFPVWRLKGKTIFYRF